MTPDRSWEAEVNEWYDKEHIPLRMEAPGFRSAQRYRIPADRHYLAVYEMDSPAVLRTPAYDAIKNRPSERTRWMLGSGKGFTRYIAEQIAEHRQPDLPSAIEPLDGPILFSEAHFATTSSEVPMPKLSVRRQDPYVALTKEQFRERFFARFYDPAFDEVRAELEKVFEKAWDGYIVYRKSPRHVAAGADFAEPSFELPVEWLDTRARGTPR